VSLQQNIQLKNNILTLASSIFPNAFLYFGSSFNHLIFAKSGTIFFLILLFALKEEDDELLLHMFHKFSSAGNKSFVPEPPPLFDPNPPPFERELFNEFKDELLLYINFLFHQFLMLFSFYHSSPKPSGAASSLNITFFLHQNANIPSSMASWLRERLIDLAILLADDFFDAHGDKSYFLLFTLFYLLDVTPF